MDTDIPVKILLWFDFWGVQDSGLDGLWIWLVNKKCIFTYQLLPALQEYSLNLFLNALLTHCHGIFCVTFTVQGKLLSKVHVELSEDVEIYMKVSKKCVWLYGGKTLLSFFRIQTEIHQIIELVSSGRKRLFEASAYKFCLCHLLMPGLDIPITKCLNKFSFHTL